jgi:hypothetical protein
LDQGKDPLNVPDGRGGAAKKNLAQSLQGYPHHLKRKALENMPPVLSDSCQS